MKKVFAIVCFVSICLLRGSAQNTILWKITKQGSPYNSYLLGTYHLFGSSFVDRFPVIRQSLNSTAMVITEVKIDAKKMYAYYNARPASDSVFRVLSPSDSTQLMVIFPPGQPIDIRKFTAGELYFKLMAFYPRLKCDLPGKNDASLMDAYIQHLAESGNKQQYELESDSFQVEKLREATRAYDWAFFKNNVPAILAALNKKETGARECVLERQYAALSINYNLNNKCEIFAGRAYNTELLQKRNEDWMQKLPPLLETSNCFIAVGLAHLFNQCGLIQALRERGFVVEPVSMEQGR